MNKMEERLSVNIENYNNQQIAAIVKDLLNKGKKLLKIIIDLNNKEINVIRELTKEEISTTLETKLYNKILNTEIMEWHEQISEKVLLDIMYYIDQENKFLTCILTNNKKEFLSRIAVPSRYTNKVFSAPIYTNQQLDTTSILFCLSSKKETFIDDIDLVIKVLI